jgi:uncharacterized protein YdiU (UPF0061 family)
MGWNLGQLAQSLSLIEEDDALIDALRAYADNYEAALVQNVARRLRIEAPKDGASFVKLTFNVLDKSRVSWPNFFHDWSGGAARAPLQDSPDSVWGDWKAAYAALSPTGPRPATERPATLLYEEIGALWDTIAKADDWSHFRDKLASYDRRNYSE